MAERLLDPVQIDAAATTLEDLATVPTGKEWAFSVLVANRTGSGKTFRLSIAPGGGADDPSQYIAFDEAIAANERTEFRGLTASDDTVIRTYASAASAISFSLVGVERDL